MTTKFYATTVLYDRIWELSQIETERSEFLSRVEELIHFRDELIRRENEDEENKRT